MAILNLRVAIGDLTDAEMGQLVLFGACGKLEKTFEKAQSLCAACFSVIRSGKYSTIGDEAMREIIEASGAPPSYAPTLLLAIREMQRRDLLYRRASKGEWDGAVPLNRLFEGEHIPDNPEAYLDQRYIDYLAKNSEDMKQIHWRNFERLTTEFFKRQGYEVDLGPGTKDGGVDVRIWTDKEAKSGPPLMLLQCKRYKNEVVGIETIKAFWSDVHFEEANKGLIATTSSVSKASKAVCEARKWPMTFAESDEVHRWARSMWRHKHNIRRGRK